MIAAVAMLAIVSGSLVARQLLADDRAAQERAAENGPVRTTTSPPATTPPSAQPTQAPPNFTAVLARTSPSVVRVIASTCQGSGVGSGFLLGPDLVVASYPSVAQSVATVVQLGDEVIPARVTGTDP